MRIYIQIDGLFQSKLGILETGDTLRIPQVDHNYRYPKISQIFKPVYFCRYVGDNN